MGGPSFPPMEVADIASSIRAMRCAYFFSGTNYLETKRVEFKRTFSGFPPFPSRHVRFESNSSKRFQLRSSIAARRRLCHVGRIKAWIPLPPPLRSRLDPIPPSPQRESLPGMRFTTALVAVSRRRHVSLKSCLKSWRFPSCCFCFHSSWNKKQEDSLFFFRERGPEDGLLAEASP